MLTTLPPEIKETLAKFNLLESEYRKICMNLGREPNLTELGMFSVLWSEHCCYKHSRHLLKKLPTEGPQVLVGPGENAGVVDVGDNIQVAFKIESHNHPTAVEPFQGATTGVGGILRDIFTMNARPVALLNSLKFGPLTDSHNHYLFTHAVKGIGYYGNCVGVPTLAGDVFFEDTYSANPLVNAMAVGLLYDMNIMNSGVQEVGNPILYVGSSTGKDGMGGAAFASKELDEDSHEDRPAVQVGDPFAEKLLIESCLEAFASGYVLSAQDMGAAGLTCASSEMAEKGDKGMRVILDDVPAREADMTPMEYLLSESQERMFMEVKKGHEQDVIDIFKKWDVPAVVVGEVLKGEQVQVYHKGQMVVDLPVKLLTSMAPSYARNDILPEPDVAKERRERKPEDDFEDIKPEEIEAYLGKLLESSNIAQAHGVFNQYDRHVQNNTLISSENQASGVIKIRDKNNEHTGKAIAMTVDCNPRYIYLEPFKGTMSAVAESVRNLIAVGASPLAVTNNLNFGNPEKDDIYYQLYNSIDGLKRACETFNTPVTGGNVSLYNEHSGVAIYPAPVIGMVGLIEDDTKIMTPQFKSDGDLIALVGRFRPTLGGSEYLFNRTGEVYGPLPEISLNDETALMPVILKLIQDKSIESVQDISTGGLLVTLCECAFLGNKGLSLNLDEHLADKRLDNVLFGETNGAFIISYKKEQAETIKTILDEQEINMLEIGEVTASQDLTLNNQSISLGPLEEKWTCGLSLQEEAL